MDDAPFASAARPTQPDVPFAVAPVDLPGVRQHMQEVRGAASFGDYLTAGWQQSVTGLATRGKMPDVAMDEGSPWYARLASSLATLSGDAPAMVPGFLGGSAVGGAAGTAVPVVGNVAGAAIGGFAGAGALPAGIRAALMDAYTNGSVKTPGEFVERALHITWETAKGGIVGAATGSAGIAARAGAPAVFGVGATNLAAKTAVTATSAEVAALASVGRALEGKLPAPEDFLDAAVLLGGVKGAAATAGKLRTIYAVTGREPALVLADARANPALLENLKSPEPMIEIPPEYRPAAIAESARAAIPDLRTNEAEALNATAVAMKPFAEIPRAAGEPSPTHVNYRYVNSPEEVQGAMARLSEIYEQRITEQRRGEVSWEQTSQEAGKILADTLGGVDARLLMPREPGTPAGAAEILARKQMVIGAAEDMSTRAKEFLARGANASPEETAAFFASIERAAMIQSEFLGARAEAGRALNILKSTTEAAARAKQIKQVVEMYGKDPQMLATMIGEIDNAAGALKFAKEAVKASGWDKFVEAWKAGLLSGPITHVANLMGNTAFMAMRAPIDAIAAGIGVLRGAGPAERVMLTEPIARATGAIMGSFDGLKLAGAVLRTGETPGVANKAEGAHGKAIEGVKGEVIRFPFRLLSAEDQIFRTMNERGELYTLAVRQASNEGLNPLTAEFRQRIAQLVQNPTEEAAAAAKDAAERFTFNKELGDKGQALQSFVRTWHLEWLLPFIRTPTNIVKELTRMTPLAPFMKEWNAAFKAGGAERDKAIAEVMAGTAIMTVVFVKALEGAITGAGEPDSGKQRVQKAAGWQPYSVKVGDTYYSYERLQPISTLVGMAADMANIWDHMTEEESDHIPKMVGIAFANNVTSQTFLQGVTRLMQAMSEPDRRAGKFFEGLAGSLVPGAVAQAANAMDPMAREVDGMLQAIQSRVPGYREQLLPKRDIFGEPEANKERLAGVTPITEKKESDDKVRIEAARLNLAASDAPKKVHVGRGSGKLGDTKLTAEQRDVFADVGGHLAHEILEPIVNSPSWEGLPDLVQKRIYTKAFRQAHKAGAAAALPPALRQSLIEQITEKLQAELAPAEEEAGG